MTLVHSEPPSLHPSPGWVPMGEILWVGPLRMRSWVSSRPQSQHGWWNPCWFSQPDVMRVSLPGCPWVGLRKEWRKEDEDDDKGRKERKMKEKMTNGTLMDSNLLFIFSPVPGSKQWYFFFFLCTVTLLLKFFSPLHCGSHIIWREVHWAEHSG